MWDLNNEEDEEEEEWPTPCAPESSGAPSAGMQAPSDPVATEGEVAGLAPDAVGEEAGYDVLADSDFDDEEVQVVEEEVVEEEEPPAVEPPAAAAAPAEAAPAEAAPDAEQLITSSTNITGYKGVYPHPRLQGKFIAAPGPYSARVANSLGTFSSPLEAARAFARHRGVTSEETRSDASPVPVRGAAGAKRKRKTPRVGMPKTKGKRHSTFVEVAPAASAPAPAQAAEASSSGGAEAIAWLSSGHKLLGTRVARLFHGQITSGTITMWVGADVAEGDPALFRMEHDDGDEEDLEEEEVAEGVRLYRTHHAAEQRQKKQKQAPEQKKPQSRKQPKPRQEAPEPSPEPPPVATPVATPVETPSGNLSTALTTVGGATVDPTDYCGVICGRGMASVAALLELWRIGEYRDAFDDQGYDDLDFILRLDAEGLDDLTSAVGMKAGHARKFSEWVQSNQKVYEWMTPSARLQSTGD